MHRTDDKEDGGDRLAGPSPAVLPVRPGSTEFQNRRTDPPLLSGSTAGDLTSGSPAPFIELGSAVQAVVLKLANSRVRIRVAKTVGEDDDGLRL